MFLVDPSTVSFIILFLRLFIIFTYVVHCLVFISTQSKCNVYLCFIRLSLQFFFIMTLPWEAIKRNVFLHLAFLMQPYSCRFICHSYELSSEVFIKLFFFSFLRFRCCVYCGFPNHCGLFM